MSSFFDELESQLRTAARERVTEPSAARTPRRHRGWSWLRSGAGLVPTLAAVAVAIVVAGGALLLFAHRTHHRGGASTGSLQSILRSTPPARLKHEFSYIQAATRRVQGSRACQIPQPANATFINGSPGIGLVSMLEPLRRTQTRADRINLSSLSASDPVQVYRRYTRRAFSAHGASYYIVPVHQNRSAGIPSDHCFALQEAALRAYAPRIPQTLRAQTLALQVGFIDRDRKLVAITPLDSVCIVTTMGRGSTSDCGLTASQIRNGVPASHDNGTFTGIVPDGVASVTLSLPAIKGAPAGSILARVHRNLYVIQGPRAWDSYEGTLEPTVQWRSPQGHVIRTIAAPTAAAIKYCARHATDCAALSILHTSSSGAGYSGTVLAPKVVRERPAHK